MFGVRRFSQYKGRLAQLDTLMLIVSAHHALEIAVYFSQAVQRPWWRWWGGGGRRCGYRWCSHCQRSAAGWLWGDHRPLSEPASLGEGKSGRWGRKEKEELDKEEEWGRKEEKERERINREKGGWERMRRNNKKLKRWVSESSGGLIKFSVHSYRTCVNSTQHMTTVFANCFTIQSHYANTCLKIVHYFLSTWCVERNRRL